MHYVPKINAKLKLNGKPLDWVNEVFDRDYLSARSQIDSDLCHLTLEGGDAEPSRYVFTMKLGTQLQFETICMHYVKMNNKIATQVNMSKFEVNEAGNRKCIKSYGPFYYNHECDETAYRYLMLYGERLEGYFFNNFSSVMPRNMNLYFLPNVKFGASDINLTLPAAADANLLATWLRPLLKDLPKLTITSHGSFVIDNTARKKLLTVLDLTINGRTDLDVEFLEGISGFNFHYNDPQGLMPIPVNKRFVDFFISRHTSPGIQSHLTRTIVFTVTLSEKDREQIGKHLSSVEYIVEAEGFFSITEQLIVKTIEWNATSLKMKFSDPPVRH